MKRVYVRPTLTRLGGALALTRDTVIAPVSEIFNQAKSTTQKIT